MQQENGENEQIRLNCDNSSCEVDDISLTNEPVIMGVGQRSVLAPHEDLHELIGLLNKAQRTNLLLYILGQCVVRNI